MKVLIADDDSKYRNSLRRALEAEWDLEVVGEAADGEEVVHLTREHKPDVVLIDIDMPGAAGLEATLRIKALIPETRVIMLSSIMLSILNEQTCRNAAERYGADAFLPKKARVWEILSAIRGKPRSRLPWETLSLGRSTR